MNIITRQEAIKQNLTRYFTGIECNKGHISERWTCNSLCRECFLEKYKQRMLATTKKHPCVRCGVLTISAFKMCGKCLSNARAWSAKLRKETLDAYGGKCTCCGETNCNYLTIDHIKSDGKKTHDGNGNRGGIRFYAKLRRTNFPKEFPKGSPLQILCANCHLAKSYFGGCGNYHNSQTTI